MDYQSGTDPRQARSDQRWVEAFNNGSQDIPPYGVCEYTDSLFPDKVAKRTRQVLEITRPTADSLTTVCVNGPAKIPKGRYGKVTLDYPTYALYTYSSASDDQPAVGEEWGTEADKFTLKKGNTGFQVIGGKVNSGATAAVRVERTGKVARIRFLNNSSEFMPAYGIGRITAYSAANGYYTINKPNTTFDRLYLINGAARVEADEYGFGFLLEPSHALYRSAAGTPAIGESWGPKSGQWTLEKNYYGFTILGGVDADATTVRVQQHLVNEIIGKTDASHAKSASGTVSVWAGALGSEADTGCNVTAYNRFAAVATTKWVGAKWVGGGWDLTAAEC